MYSENPARPAIQPDRSRYNPTQKVHVEVLGHHDVFGNEPGQQAEIEVTQGQLDVLLSSGAVKVVEPVEPKEAADEEVPSVETEQAEGEALPAETVEE